MHHTIKTHAELYHRVKSGEKRFDIRKDDRSYQCGDTVTLIHYDPKDGTIPGPGNLDLEPLDFRIGFVLRGGQYGLEPGYVAFQLEPAEIVSNGIPDCEEPGAEPWRMHEGGKFPRSLHGANVVMIVRRDGQELKLIGHQLTSDYPGWRWSTDQQEIDIVRYQRAPNT